MKHIITKALAVGLLCTGLGVAAFTGIPAQLLGAARVAGAAAVLSPDDSAVLQANGILVRAFERDDAATVARLLDADFTWIDTHGVLRSREEVLQGLPPIAAPAGAEKPGRGRWRRQINFRRWRAGGKFGWFS